jgi:hypothetical protein
LATTLEESARRAGAHQWAESRLFEILGGWVASTPEPGIRVMLDRHSRHCAWRAAQWWDRLPVLAEVDRAALCAEPPGPQGWAARLADLEGTPARLAGAYRVALPRLWVAYDRHDKEADDVSDASTRRTLEIVAPDVAADWREGEAALQEILATRADVDAASAAAKALEEMLLGHS